MCESSSAKPSEFGKDLRIINEECSNDDGIKKDEIERLYDFAYIPDKCLVKLDEIILKEIPWKDKKCKENYLKYTYLKIVREGKLFKKDGYACFNTGLLDNLYRNIYMVFEKNKNAGKQPFYCIGFCVEAEGGWGKKILELFNPLPDSVHYFDNPSNFLYYPIVAPKVDWKYIIVDNVDRFPKKFLSEKLGIDKGRKFDKSELKEILKTNDNYFFEIKKDLEKALEIALNRIRLNYRIVTPAYYPRLDKITLLLPLSLTKEDRVDIALVVEKKSPGEFIVHTILSLEDAYNNAFLITQVDNSDWLSYNYDNKLRE